MALAGGLAGDLHQVRGFAHNAQSGATQGHAQRLSAREPATYWLYGHIDQRLIGVADEASCGASDGLSSLVEALGGQIIDHPLVAAAQLDADLG